MRTLSVTLRTGGRSEILIAVADRRTRLLDAYTAAERKANGCSDRFAQTVSRRPLLGLLCPQMRQVLVVLQADIFQQIPSRGIAMRQQYARHPLPLPL